MDLKSLEIVDEKSLSSFESEIIKYRIESSKVFKKLWDNLLIKKIAKAALESSLTLSGVEAYTWYRGCAPTSIAMVINYTGKESIFSNLRHNVSNFNWTGPPFRFKSTSCS
jgi:uncharacterized protein YvpB